MRSAVLIVAMLSAALTACSIEADFSDVIEVETLSAEEYRFEIAAIDQLLFAEEPLGEKKVQKLARLFDELGKRVGAHSQSKFIKLETLEIRLMAEQARRLPPTGTGAPLQMNWMRIRNNLFDDRAWFVRSAADLEYARSEVPLPPEQPAPPPVETSGAPVSSPARDPHRAELDGAWEVVSIHLNNELTSDPELSASIWTFDAPRLTIRDASSGKEEAYTYTRVRGADATYLRVSNASVQDGWMLYQLGTGELTLAFNDNLGGRPTGFTVPPGHKDPPLVVVRLRPVLPPV